MREIVRTRLLICVALALLQVFGTVGPVWALAAQAGRVAADPTAQAELCVSHPGGATEQAPATPTHQSDGLCSHCQWCHAAPLALAAPPLRLPLPRAAEQIARHVPPISLPGTASHRGAPARAPPLPA